MFESWVSENRKARTLLNYHICTSYMSIHKHMQLADLNIYFIQSSDWIETFRLSNIPYNTMTKRTKERNLFNASSNHFQPQNCKILNLYHNFINRGIDDQLKIIGTQYMARMTSEKQWQIFKCVRSFCTRWKSWNINMLASTYRNVRIRTLMTQVVLPILLGNLRLLKYEFPFLVLLWCLESSFILPTQNFTTIRTIDIGNSVETSQEMPIFFWAYNNIHRVGEQKGSTISSLNKIMENNIGLKHLPTTPIIEVKMITLTHTKFLQKQ